MYTGNLLLCVDTTSASDIIAVDTHNRLSEEETLETDSDVKLM